MTAPLDPTPPAPKLPPTRIAADDTTRLGQLLSLYETVKAQADSATAALEAIKAGIKVELSALLPEGDKAIDATHPGLAKPLRLVAVTQWRVDTDRMKREDPQAYARYAKQSTSWQLKAVS